MIISFAWTTPALLAGAKTVTRREWKPEHAAKFYAGQLVDAWDRSPRVGRSSGARKVATIRLRNSPRVQLPFTRLTRDDLDREGFAWLRANQPPHALLDFLEYTWATTGDPRALYVVEFELVEVLA